jgi:ribosomal protein S10
MSEDQQLRMEAMRLAVKVLESRAIDMAKEDIVEMASKIYTFISGETK